MRDAFRPSRIVIVAPLSGPPAMRSKTCPVSANVVGGGGGDVDGGEVGAEDPLHASANAHNVRIVALENMS